MLNKNIAYIDYIEKEQYGFCFKKMLFWFLNTLNYIRKEENRYILLTNIINKKKLKKLVIKLKKDNTKNVVLPEKFFDKEFVEVLKKDFYVLDGKWISSFLLANIFKKIANIQNKKMDKYEITFLCNNVNDVVLDNIRMFSKKCKILNILTNNKEAFKNIEDELYEKNGFILNVSSNYKKVCLYSNIIVNIDFSNEELEKCNFRKKSILIQNTKEKIEKENCLIIRDITFSFSNRFLDLNNKHYRKEILYESLLFHNTSFYNVRKLLKRDKLEITTFEGIHGKLNFREIQNNV